MGRGFRSLFEKMLNVCSIPRLLQNSPSMPSGLAVGIWVRPVRIRTSLFFRELWSIG